MEIVEEKVRMLNGEERTIKVKKGLGYLTVANILGKAMKVSAVKGKDPEIDLATLMTEGVKAVIVEPKGFNLDLLSPEDGLRLYREYVEPFLVLEQGNPERDQEDRSRDNAEEPRGSGSPEPLSSPQNRLDV